MKLSALAFPWGQCGVLVCHSMPRTFIYLSYSCPFNGGPLLVLSFFGMPWVAKILSSFGMHALASVELTISTSGNLEYVSITTSRYSPVSSFHATDSWFSQGLDDQRVRVWLLFLAILLELLIAYL